MYKTREGRREGGWTKSAVEVLGGRSWIEPVDNGDG